MASRVSRVVVSRSYPIQTFSVDIRLHACVLINYHHGSYRFKTRIAGTEVDDVIDHSSSRTYRHHNISLSQIRAAYKLKRAGQVRPASVGWQDVA